MKSNKNKFKIIVTLLLVIGVGIVYYLYNNSFNQVSYNDFLSKVNNKEITEVNIDFTKTYFKIKDKNNNVYKVENPKYDDFKKDLLLMDVNVKESVISLSKLSSIIYLVILLLMIVVIKSSLKSINRKIGKVNYKTDVKFDEVIGLNSIKNDLMVVVDFIKNPQKYKNRGIEMPKGAILYGEAGTGKTMIAKAIANETGINFISATGSDFVELYVGQGAKRVRELFELARKKSPCILFIDEIDAIGKRDGSSRSNEKEQTINQLLVEMDGFGESSGIFVLGATNRLDMLDEALIRRGRFDKHIHVPLPSTPQERLEIIKLYSKNKKFDDTINLNDIAKQTVGFSPADLKSLINESALISVELNKDSIDKECIDNAMFRRITSGHEDKSRIKTEEEIKLTAYHEAGHTIIAKKFNMNVSKVSITSSTNGMGGMTLIIPKEGLLSKEEIEQNIMVQYGGRSAELVLFDNDFNKISTGAVNDINTATKMIKSMAESYGMFQNIGLVNLSLLNNKEANDIITNTIIDVAKELNNKTYKILCENKESLAELANKLIEEETIYEEDIDKIIGS